MREEVVVEVRHRVRGWVGVVRGYRVVLLRLRVGVGMLGVCGLLGHVVEDPVVGRSAGAFIADLAPGDGVVGASGSMVGGFLELRDRCVSLLYEDVGCDKGGGGRRVQW